MDDQRSAEGVEHLQAAARELLLAARSFLSVVEEVVEDRERFAGAAAGVADLLREGLAGAMPPSSPLQPWEQAAWAGAPTNDDDPDHTDDGSSDPLSTGDDEASAGADATEAAAAATTAPADEAPVKKAPAKKAPARRAPAKRAAGTATAAAGDPSATAAGPPRRVRRIAVD